MVSPTVRELPLTLNLSPSLYEHIGRIVSAHAQIEWVLNRIVYSLLKIEPVHGRIAVREPRTTDRLDMITDLMKLMGIGVPTDVIGLRTLLEGCYKERDCLAHGIWVHDKTLNINFLRIISGNWQPPGTNQKSKRRIDLEATKYDVTDAKAVLETTLGTLQALNVLKMEVEAAIATLPRKSP
jgi:hypothetical protein